MEKEPREAFDAIRKHLQLILARAELCGNSQCEDCACNVGEIVTELRVLEAYIQEVASALR